MWNMTNAAFGVVIPPHEVEIEIEVVMTAKSSGVGKSTILSQICRILEEEGFKTRINHEEAKLQGKRGKRLAAFPSKLNTFKDW